MSLLKIKDALENGRLVLGTHCTSADISLYEMCGYCGYDYVWVDAEHGPMSLPTILHGVVGTNAGGCAAFVRTAWNDPVLAKPVLEMGPDGLIFPMVNSAEEAERAVKSCMYPPRGIRGYGPIRAIGYCGDAGEYIQSADHSMFKIIQAEHIDCVNNLHEILEVPGIDLVMVGPMDLSASVGKLGKLNDPEVQELIRKIAVGCNEKRVRFGLSVGYDLDLVKYFIDLGASYITMGNAYLYFSMMSRLALKEIKTFEKSAVHSRI